MVFEQALDHIAWKTIPSWYLVFQENQAIPLELQRFMAERMGAETTEIKASHMPLISHPSEVVKMIEAAAAVHVK